jgi:hypothetical protein
MEIMNNAQPMLHGLLGAAEDNHLDLEWGVTQGTEIIRVGWGCPLHAPIQNISAGIGGDLLGYINYFLPLAEFSGILGGWLIAIGAYYMGSIVFRWVKAIS